MRLLLSYDSTLQTILKENAAILAHTAHFTLSLIFELCGGTEFEIEVKVCCFFERIHLNKQADISKYMANTLINFQMCSFGPSRSKSPLITELFLLLLICFIFFFLSSWTSN
jgi:hypothetical protein